MIALDQNLKWFYLYPLAHLFFYTVLFRYLRTFSKERTIFLYHSLSGLGLAVLMFCPLVVSTLSQKLTAITGVLSFHGIYSLSFLELWWLSDGGYSLRILDEMDHTASKGPASDFSNFQNLGNAKKKDRLESLRQLGLTAHREDKYSLTFSGRCFTGFLYLIQWPSNILKAD